MAANAQLFTEGSNDPTAVELRVADGHVEASADGSVVASLPLDSVGLSAGGFDGAHLFLRSPNGETTLASNDPEVFSALERAADPRLRAMLDEAVAQRERHQRLDALGLWVYRLRWPVLLAAIGLTVAVTWLYLR